MKKVKAFLCVALCAIISFSLCGCVSSGYTVFNETEAFSSDIMFSAKIMGGRTRYAYDVMCGVIVDIDKQCSTTKEDSDISRFNRANANEPVKVGMHCYNVYLQAKECYTLTNGAYNPTVMPLTELWHVDASSISQYRPSVGEETVSPSSLPSLEEVENVLEYCSLSNVENYESNGEYYLVKKDSRIKLDFGGIAKGYAIDRCVDILDEYEVSSALIDISGNVYLYGNYIERGNERDWRVGVASPRPRAGETLARNGIAVLSISGNQSAVTSGDYMRYYIYTNTGGENVYVPHIIGKDGVPIGVYYDGNTWKNSNDNVISVTVIGDSSAMCDGLATAVCVLGLEDGARLLQEVGYKGLIFTEKRYIIVGNTELCDDGGYDGYKSYEKVELSELGGEE